MAVDMFLDMDGIKGESIDSKHKDTIDVLSWSWGMSQTGTTHLGGGEGLLHRQAYCSREADRAQSRNEAARVRDD